MTRSVELFEAGRLEEAIRSATDDVKARPADEGARAFLAELLCFTGEYERADKQLDALVNVNPEGRVPVSVVRQLMRAAMARREVFLSGRVPELLDDPPESLRRSLEALAALRSGDTRAAVELTRAAEEARRSVSGRYGSRDFDEFRDLDDILGGVFEVLTANGTYYWVPVDRLERFEVRPPQRPFDLLWAPVSISVRSGPDGEVYVPTTYVSAGTLSDALTLGRTTEWEGDGEAAPVRGLGQKMFLVGDEAVPVLELGAITFEEGGD